MKKGQKLYYLRFVIPAAILIYSFGSITSIKFYYDKLEQDLIKQECAFATFELEDKIKTMVMARAKILSTLADVAHNVIPHNEKRFYQVTSTVMKNMPNFSGINWIDPRGYIRWSFPPTKTNAARNQEILSAPSVRDYLLTAKETKTPQLSHFIITFEKIEAFIIYAAIYHEGKFYGWINGVFEVKKFFDSEFSKRGIENLHLKIKWTDHPGSVYTYNNPGELYEIISNFQIMNQSLQLQADLSKSGKIAKRRSYVEWLVLFSYFASVILSLFVYRQIKMRYELTVSNKKLKRDKTLLNILSHDLAAPLTLVTENAIRLKDKLKDEYIEVDRILKSSERQKDLLSRVRSFHATNLGRIKLNLEHCSVADLISESLLLYEQQLKNKNVSYNVHIPDNIPDCIADRIIAIHNVLGNVLSNAIKFSNTNSLIEISARTEGKYIVIDISDTGTGIPNEILEDLFDETQQASTQGTIGEMGTGLGMLQIKSFMDYFKGKLKIKTDAKGTTVSLFFRKA